MLSECTEDVHVVYKYYRIFIELLINKNTCNKEKYKGILCMHSYVIVLTTSNMDHCFIMLKSLALPTPPLEIAPVCYVDRLSSISSFIVLFNIL